MSFYTYDLLTEILPPPVQSYANNAFVNRTNTVGEWPVGAVPVGMGRPPSGVLHTLSLVFNATAQAIGPLGYNIVHLYRTATAAATVPTIIKKVSKTVGTFTAIATAPIIKQANKIIGTAGVTVQGLSPIKQAKVIRNSVAIATAQLGKRAINLYRTATVIATVPTVKKAVSKIVGLSTVVATALTLAQRVYLRIFTAIVNMTGSNPLNPFTAFPNIPFPQHLSGQTQVSSDMSTGAVLPIVTTPNVLSYTNAFPSIPYPNHLSGQSNPQNYIYPGALQPTPLGSSNVTIQKTVKATRVYNVTTLALLTQRSLNKTLTAGITITSQIIKRINKYLTSTITTLTTYVASKSSGGVTLTFNATASFLTPLYQVGKTLVTNVTVTSLIQKMVGKTKTFSVTCGSLIQRSLGYILTATTTVTVPAIIKAVSKTVGIANITATALTLAQRVYLRSYTAIVNVTGSGSWTPLSLSNVVGYWNAGLGVSQSGGLVSAWADQSPNNNNLTGYVISGALPSYSATGFNSSYPGITVNTGNNNELYNTTVSLSSTTFSFFGLVITNGGLPNARLFGLEASGVGNDFVTPSICLTDQSEGGTAYPYAYSSGYLGAGGTTYYTQSGGQNTPQLLGLILDGTNAHLYVNGPEIPTPSAFTASVGTNPNTLVLGADVGSGENFTGTYAFCIMTSAAMSPTDIANLIYWTNANWGTSFPGGSAGGNSAVTIIKQINKFLTSTITAVAQAAQRSLTKTINAGVVAASQIIKQVNKTLTETVVVVAKTLAQKVFIRSYTATTIVTASFLYQVAKTIQATATATVKYTKQIGKSLLSNVTVALLTPLYKIGKTLLSNVTTTASDSKSVGKTLTGTVTATSKVQKAVGKLYNFGATCLALSQKTSGYIINTTVTTTSLITKQVRKTLTETITTGVTFSTLKIKLVTVTATAVVTALYSKSVLKTLTFVGTATVKYSRALAKTLTGAVVASLSLTKQINKTFSATITALGLIQKTIDKTYLTHITATATRSVSLGKNIVHSCVVTVNKSILVSKSILFGVTATSFIQKMIGKTFNSVVTALNITVAFFGNHYQITIAFTVKATASISTLFQIGTKVIVAHFNKIKNNVSAAYSNTVQSVQADSDKVTKTISSAYGTTVDFAKATLQKIKGINGR